MTLKRQHGDESDNEYEQDESQDGGDGVFRDTEDPDSDTEDTASAKKSDGCIDVKVHVKLYQ